MLYGREAAGTIVRWINDASPVVRWVVCGCLHDYGDLHVAAALLDRLKHDDDGQVRGAAAGALGQIGVIEALPGLHRTYHEDREVDPLGHSPSSQAQDAMTSILRTWVSQRLRGTPPKHFREATQTGQLTATVTAEGIPFDTDGRMTHTLRYAHVPPSALGHGWASKMDLQTSLVAPFEINVEYVDPTCAVRRILVFQQITDSDELNWAVHTILDPAAVKLPPWP